MQDRTKPVHLQNAIARLRDGRIACKLENGDAKHIRHYRTPSRM